MKGVDGSLKYFSLNKNPPSVHGASIGEETIEAVRLVKDSGYMFYNEIFTKCQTTL